MTGDIDWRCGEPWIEWIPEERFDMPMAAFLFRQTSLVRMLSMTAFYQYYIQLHK